LLLVWVGGWWFTAFILVAGLLVLREWNTMTGVAPVLFPLGATAIVAAVILANLDMDGIAIVAILSVAFVLWLIGWARKEDATWIAGGVFYAGLPLIAVIMIRNSQDQALAAIIFIFATVWVTDSAAYLSGRTIGGAKLWPAVSPNKTWAGLIGGMVGAAAFGAVFAVVSGLSDLIWLAALGAILAIVSQGGDLFESSVKRRFGVKDSGKIIPGHGGIMDRVDGMVAAALFAAMIGISRSGFDNVAAGLLEWR
jgi:phosphatidate cytidylyltransferase